MPQYEKKISKIIHDTHNATPSQVFNLLLVGYQRDAKGLFSRRHHQFFITRLLAILQDPTAGEQLWAKIADRLNDHLPLHQLNKHGDFAQLLQAFLNFYPGLTKFLRKDLLAHLSSSPFLFSVVSELDQLVASLGKDHNTDGLAAASFANLMLAASAKTRTDIFEKFLLTFNAQANYVYQLQLARSLIAIKLIVPRELIQHITNTLCAPLCVPQVLTPDLKQSITFVLGKFADTLTDQTKMTFLSLYSNVTTDHCTIGMLKNLNDALPYLIIDQMKTLISPLLELVLKKQVTPLAAAAAETLALVINVYPDHAVEKIQLALNSLPTYHANHFKTFDTLTTNYPETAKMAALEDLLTILATADFIEPYLRFEYTQEDRNRKACEQSIKTLFTALSNTSKMRMLENVLTLLKSLPLVKSYQLHEIINELAGAFKLPSLQGTMDYFIELSDENKDAMPHWQNLLAIAARNEQTDIIKNFIDRLSSPENRLTHDRIIHSITCHAYVDLRSGTRAYFFEKIGQSYAQLDLTSQYQFINQQGWYIEHAPHFVPLLLEAVKPYFTFSVDAIPVLNYDGMAFIKPLLTADQITTLLRYLKNTAEQNPLTDNFQETRLNFLNLLSLFAPLLKDHDLKLIDMARHLAEELLTDASRRFDQRYISSLVNIIQAIHADEIPALLAILMPLFHSKKEILASSSFLKQIMKKMPMLFIRPLLQELSVSLRQFIATDDARKFIVFRHLDTSLGLMPASADYYKDILQSVVAAAPSMNLPDNFKLRSCFIYAISTLAAEDPLLIHVLKILVVQHPDCLRDYHAKQIFKHVIRSKNNRLIEIVINRNIARLPEAEHYCTATQNLVIMADLITARQKQRLGEVVSHLFNDSKLAQLAAHPYALEQTLMTGHPNLFFSQLLELVDPAITAAVLAHLFENFHSANPRESNGMHRLLQRLYPQYVQAFETIVTVNLQTWFNSNNAEIRDSCRQELLKHLKIMEFSPDLIARAVQQTPDNLKPQAIDDICRLSARRTAEVSLFARQAIAVIFSEWSIVYKELLMHKLMKTLTTPEALTPTTDMHMLEAITSQINAMQNSDYLKYIVRDAYSTELMSSPHGNYSLSRKHLLYMVSAFHYAASIKPTVIKVMNNADLAAKVMRFLA